VSGRWVVQRKRALGCFVLGLIGLACSGPQDSAIALATDSIAPWTPETAEVPRSYPLVNKDDPFGVFAVEPTNDAEATSRITPVWMINHASESVVVSARGGAGSVVLDTIGAADSVLVRIDTRARTVVLEALAPGSVSLGTVAVPMDSEPKRVAFPQ